MRANQKLYDDNGYQVALFPLEGFHVSQADNGTYSHGGGALYWATDYLGWNLFGRVYRDPCYAPVDIKCIWLNKANCVAVWESLQKVHLANGMIDFLTLTVYHDQDITNGLITVGTVKQQGQQFNRTGTGGNVTGDHVHLETGYGRYTLPYNTSGNHSDNYKFHITDYTTCKRLHNYDALFINDTFPIQSPSYYNWRVYEGGSPTPTPPSKKKYRFKWVLYANKLRNK